MNAELIGWDDEQSLDHRRRLRNAMLVSLAVHGSVFALFAVTPPRSMAPLAASIAVELVAAPASASQANPRAKSAPAAKSAPSKPAPPAPAPPIAPPAPVPKAPVQVLPEEAPSRIQKAPTEPVKPKDEKLQPKPKPEPVRPKRDKELSYDAAMASLDEELGEDETADLLTPKSAPNKAANSSATTDATQTGAVSRAGVTISPEQAAWNLAVQRLIQSKWVTPPNFRGRGLATGLELRLSATGELIGPPTVVRSSGDPYYDDNAVRALLTVAPLPPPIKPGRQFFLFNAEAN